MAQTAATAPALDSDALVNAFRRMLLIRRFEERVVELNAVDDVPGVTSVYIGQEATGVGLALALRPQDWIFTTHRNHGHVLARGADPNRVMAELFGKATGYCGGKGGGFHVSSVELGVPSASAIVAAGTATATGAALGFKLRHQARVAVALLGDRSLNEGTFWEALNLAALWRVPVVFLCENNDAVPYDALKASMATERLTSPVQGFKVVVEDVDGTDLPASYAVLREAVERARRGEGPSFVETRTVAWPGNAGRGKARLVGGPTRVAAAWEPESDDQYVDWRRNEPIAKTARQLVKDGHADRPTLERLEREVSAEVETAIEFARQSPFPEAEQAFSDVYV